MRGLKISVISVFVTLGVFAACAEKHADSFSVQSSQRVEASFFRANCVVCHGVEAEGKQLAERLVPSLRTGDVLQKTDEQLYAQILNGGNGMPPFKFQMTEKQIENMVRFIRVLQKDASAK